MIRSHFALMIVFALCVSSVFAGCCAKNRKRR
jgi:hypothetical protein